MGHVFTAKSLFMPFRPDAVDSDSSLTGNGWRKEQCFV